MRRIAKAGLAALALGMTAGLASAQQGPIHDVPLRPPPPPDTTIGRIQSDVNHEAAEGHKLKIAFGKKTAQWTPAMLAQLPHPTVTVYDDYTKMNHVYAGVMLMDLLAPLGVSQKPKGKDFRLYLVAEGADGYKVVYALGEISSETHDGSVMVADTVDGKPLAEDDGPIRLVCTSEKHPARWVRNLVSIKVMAAD